MQDFFAEVFDSVAMDGWDCGSASLHAVQVEHGN